MWTKEKLCRAMADAPRLCVLLLTRDADGVWTAQMLKENGDVVPCRKAHDRKTALRAIAQLQRRTADGGKRVVAHTDDLYAAAFLAGQLGGNVSFEPLDPRVAALALLYAGSLRSSPPV